MILRLFIVVILLMESALASAFKFKGDIYGEVATQQINNSSAFNPDNLHQVGDTQYFFRSNLIFKNDFSEHLNGVVNLEGQYYPAYYTLFHPFVTSDSNAGTTTYPKERLFIKEAYMDLLTTLFVVRIGKQYIKWGKGTFFNPSDVVNFNRDPLRPKDEAEGNPFVNLSIPIQGFLTIEAITIFEQKQDPSNSQKNQKLQRENLPFIPKISFSYGNLSGFGFAVFQNTKKPIFGLNLDYAIPMGESSSTTIYAESVYLLESNRKYFNDSQVVQPMPDKNYQAIVIGARYQTSFNTLKWLEGISINAEYYYNNENWNSYEFKNYRNKLFTDKSNSTLHLTDIAYYYEPYKNSHQYGYASVYLTNFIFQSFTFGNDFVYNLEDKSMIYMPSVSYTFDNTNAEVGLKSIIYLGSNSSEFGNAISKFNLIAYTQITF